ncbi:MAG: hypothetical protein JNJ80_18880 [Gemmatimonadetes bacterium]|nr:hypothetical protein [Gemmatimonadota bacterium]MCC7131000.1 hypothetical protein [Gemmatimonadales bacterium]
MRVFVTPRSLGWILTALPLITGCGTAEPTASAGLQRGRYVLTTIDGSPLPFEIARSEDGNLIQRESIIFDTLTVLDDSTITQHARRDWVTIRDGVPEATGGVEIGATRKVYARDDELVLVAPAGLNIAPMYLTVRGADLIQRFRKVRLNYDLPGSPVQTTEVEGRYVRR